MNVIVERDGDARDHDDGRSRDGGDSDNKRCYDDDGV